VANDYIIVVDSPHLRVAKRTHNGWGTYDVDSAIIANNGTIGPMASWVIGLGDNYFVVKHNSQGDFGTASWDISVLSFGPTGLRVVRVEGRQEEQGRFYDGSAVNPDGTTRYVSMRAFCSSGYFVIESATSDKRHTVLTHFRRALGNGWPRLGSSVTQFVAAFDPDKRSPCRVHIGKNFIVVVNYDDQMGQSAINVYRRDGQGTALDRVDSTHFNYAQNHTVVCSDDYYAFTYTSRSGSMEWPGDRIRIKMWNSADRAFSDSIDSDCAGLFNISTNARTMAVTQMGDRLVVTTNGGPYAEGGLIGVLTYSPKNRNWSKWYGYDNQGAQDDIRCLSAVALDPTTIVTVRSIPQQECQTFFNVIVVHAYRLRGNSYTFARVDSFTTGHGFPSDWVWQPGQRYFGLLTTGGEHYACDDSVYLYALNDLPDGGMQFSGNPSRAVVSKRAYASGLGDSQEHRLNYQAGVMNSFNTPEFACVVDTLPGTSGWTSKMYYTSKDSLGAGGVNFRDLAGKTYSEKMISNSGTTVDEFQNSWMPTSIDKMNGVFHHELLSQWHLRDGVGCRTSYEFENPLHFQCTKITDTSSAGLCRTVETKYACEVAGYAEMAGNAHMLSQVYSVTTKKGTGVESKKWTIWGNGDGVWRQREEWAWKGDGSTNDQTAPVDPQGSSEAYLVRAIPIYDTMGHPLSIVDANGVCKAVKYGYAGAAVIASVSGASQALVFVSVFDDSSYGGWAGQYGTWAIHNGVYQQTNPTETNTWVNPRRNTLVSLDDGIFEADIRFDNQGTYRYAAVTKYIDTQNYILFQLRKTDGRVTIDATKNGISYVVNSNMTIEEQRWYHVRGEVHGDTAELFVDGQSRLRMCHNLANLPAGYIGLSTYATVASFDNVRLYPYGSLAVSQTFDPVTLANISSQDENGVLNSTRRDALSRETEDLTRSEGRDVLRTEFRHQYSRAVGDTYQRSRPNAIEKIRPPEISGYSDFSNSLGWTVYGSDITFGNLKEGETVVRMGSYDHNWHYISRSAPQGHVLARVDFYLDNATEGTPHILAFDGSGCRLCVQFNTSENRFLVQYSTGSGWNYSPSFLLPGTRERWYTIEIEKTETGDGYAFVFPKGSGRINQAGYMLKIPGYPTNWQPAVYSWANYDVYYLANHYVGLPDREVTYCDGLGRQIESQRQLKLSSVISSASQFDSAGRPYRSFKAYEKDLADTNRHRYDSLFAANADAYYNGLDAEESHTNGYPFAGTQYYADPLNRIQKQGAPGSAFAVGSGHEVQFAYSSNGANDVPGYGDSSLFKITRTDEDNTATCTYTDKWGKKVATVVDPSGLALRTTLDYDVLGNLVSSTTPRGDITTYAYTPLNQLRQKRSPDDGTAFFLYDKNGNLRLIKDSVHTGTATNNVSLSSTNIPVPYSSSGQFTLTMPGKVSITATVYDVELYEIFTIRIKANGTTIKTVQTYQFNGASGSIILPKGTYTYELQTTGSYGQFGYSISCQTGYELVYRKYDAFNRLTEVGEYESNSLSGNFTQANAENTSFPSSDTIVSAANCYDVESSDPRAAGQRNLKGRLSVAKAYRLGTLELTTSYSYDHFGNVEWVVQTNSAGRWWQVRYEYDAQGRVTKKHFLDGYSSTYNLFTFYEYDQMGRLSTVYSGPNADGTGKTTEAAYTYYAGGPTKRKQLAQVQGVDYRYNTRDWVTMINHQNLSTAQDPGQDGPGGSGVGYTDRFGMTIGYNAGSPFGGVMSTTPRSNGNISWTVYNMSTVLTNGSPLVGNAYSYDAANRILSSNFGYWSTSWQATTQYDESGYAYDGNGNITAVQRYGSNGGLMDNLGYVYSTGRNRLRHITDAVASGSYSVDIDNQATDNYGYDDNGTVQRDLQRDVAFAVNDLRNLPVSMWKASTGAEVKYYYDTEGKRIRKDASATEYYVNGTSGETEAVVKSDESGATHSILGADNLGQVKRSGSTWTRYYYLKDHLGTIKMTVDGSATVVGYDDYYPFGMQMDGRCGAGSADPRYKFTGKERDVESQYDYFGARYYDARVGRYLSVDPLSSSLGLSSWSPYHYSYSNPLRFIDPSGMMPLDPGGWETAGMKTVEMDTKPKLDRLDEDDPPANAPPIRIPEVVTTAVRFEDPLAGIRTTLSVSIGGAAALSIGGLNAQLGAAITFDAKRETPDLSLFLTGGPAVFGFLLSGGPSVSVQKGSAQDIVSPTLVAIGGWGMGGNVNIGRYDPSAYRFSLNSPTGVGLGVRGPTYGIGIFCSEGTRALWSAPPAGSAFWKR